MLIRLRCDYQGPTGSFKRGSFADLPDHIARQMIDQNQGDRVRQKLVLSTARRPAPAIVPEVNADAA